MFECWYCQCIYTGVESRSNQLKMLFFESIDSPCSGNSNASIIKLFE